MTRLVKLRLKPHHPGQVVSSQYLAATSPGSFSFLIRLKIHFDMAAEHTGERTETVVCPRLLLFPRLTFGLDSLVDLRALATL